MSASLGAIAYAAYAASTGGLTFDKRPMPTWAELGERSPGVAQAWEAAAQAVRVGVDTSLQNEVHQLRVQVRGLERLRDRAQEDGS